MHKTDIGSRHIETARSFSQDEYEHVMDQPLQIERIDRFESYFILLKIN